MLEEQIIFQIHFLKLGQEILDNSVWVKEHTVTFFNLKLFSILERAENNHKFKKESSENPKEIQKKMHHLSNCQEKWA